MQAAGIFYYKFSTMASAVVQVFGQPASTDVARVMACLLERKLDFELVRTDAFRRGRKLPELVKMRARSSIILQTLFFRTLNTFSLTLCNKWHMCISCSARDLSSLICPCVQDPSSKVMLKHGDTTLTGNWAGNFELRELASLSMPPS
jgi:hypothetical protein